MHYRFYKAEAGVYACKVVADEFDELTYDLYNIQKGRYTCALENVPICFYASVKYILSSLYDGLKFFELERNDDYVFFLISFDDSIQYAVDMLRKMESSDPQYDYLLGKTLGYSDKEMTDYMSKFTKTE